MTVLEAPASRALPGSQFPLGATVTGTGTNFAVASGVADGMLLCLFDEAGAETQIPIQDCDAGVWHVFVPGVAAGQAYGYRATGPYDPAQGVRCNPAKLLLDPYARAVAGTVRFGPEVYGYSASEPDAPDEADSAPCVPRSVVVADEPFGWRDGDASASAGTPTRSSTRCTSRASPCAIPGCRPSCAGPTPGWATRRPSPTCATSA